MTDGFSWLLLFVFSTHMPFFAWRWVRTREPRHAATAVTFALLTLVYGLRLLAPGASWGGAPAWTRLRVVAWASAALSIGLLLRHVLGRLHSRRR